MNSRGRAFDAPPPDDAPPPSYQEAIATSNNPFLRPPPSFPGPSGPSSGRPRASSAREYSQLPLIAFATNKSLISKPLPLARGQTPCQFPQSFNLYTKFRSHIMLLGQQQDQPVYSVEITVDSHNNPIVILYSGPTEIYPRLATVDFIHSSNQMSVHLPPPAAHPGASPAKVNLDMGNSFPHTSCSFTIEVGNSSPHGAGGSCHREGFEWRRSSDEAVSRLDGSYRWKLFRLAGSGPSIASDRGRLGDVSGGFRGSGSGSGEAEVVAVFGTPMFSSSRVMMFSFVGAGASGRLGERWSIVAVMTALGIYERERREPRQRRRYGRG